MSASGKKKRLSSLLTMLVAAALTACLFVSSVVLAGDEISLAEGVQDAVWDDMETNQQDLLMAEESSTGESSEYAPDMIATETAEDIPAVESPESDGSTGEPDAADITWEFEQDPVSYATSFRLEGEFVVEAYVSELALLPADTTLHVDRVTDASLCQYYLELAKEAAFGDPAAQASSDVFDIYFTSGQAGGVVYPAAGESVSLTFRFKDLTGQDNGSGDTAGRFVKVIHMQIRMAAILRWIPVPRFSSLMGRPTI